MAEHRRTLVAAGAAFLLLGAVVALYGPLFPELRARFGIGLDEVGAVVSAHFLGSFVTVIASGLMLRRFGYRKVLTVGSAALFLGLASLAFAPSWTAFVAGAGLAGLGFGAVQVAVNLLVARTFAEGAASALNLVNAVFGLGALLAPLLIALFAPNVVWPLGLLAALALVVLVALARLEEYPAAPLPAVAEHRANARAAAPSRASAPHQGGSPDGAPYVGRPYAGAPYAAIVAGFVALYFFYVSAEVGVTSWATEHLTPSFGVAIGAAATSLYWGALTFGRLIAVFVARRLSPRAMLLAGLSIGVVALLLALYTPIAPFAYGLVGVALAPTFGSGLAWLAARLPDRVEQVTPLVLAAGSLGPVSTAPFIGLFVASRGIDAVPFTLAALTALALLSVVFLARARPAPERSSATTPVT